jgi:hypothetical protein
MKDENRLDIILPPSSLTDAFQRITIDGPE